MESIKAQKLLPVARFLLDQLKNDGEQGIESFLLHEEGSSKKRRLEEDIMEEEIHPAGEEEDEKISRYFRNGELKPSDFIKSYFENSRLHFIGTWRMRIENLILEMEKVQTSRQPIKQQSSSERIIVHIDMDCFFASVAMIERRELRDVPFVVCHSNKRDGTAEISCASYPARQLGVYAGSSVSSAMKLCPTLQVVPYQFDQYQTISEKVSLSSHFLEFYI